MKSKLFIFLFLLVTQWGLAQNTHFWDGIEAFDGPTDENPVLASQLDFYFDKMVTSDNADLRDFILWHLLEKYEHPEYMSQDQVFVWLYDQYFSKLKINDLHETNLAMIQEKAERLRRLALFNIAPDIHIGDSINLHSVESEYTVLFFYDHSCEVCIAEKRELDSVCATLPEIKVLPIDLNMDQTANLSELLAIFDTYDIEAKPLIYVLDKEKRIIAKKIRAKQIPSIL